MNPPRPSSLTLKTGSRCGNGQVLHTFPVCSDLSTVGVRPFSRSTLSLSKSSAQLLRGGGSDPS